MEMSGAAYQGVLAQVPLARPHLWPPYRTTEQKVPCLSDYFASLASIPV
jgi:hypothetical protein